MPAHPVYPDVAMRLRRLIVSGRYGPGSVLPHRHVLGRQLGVCMATLQKAVDMLVADGFLVPRGSLGTFVSKTPPHLRNYGLATGPCRRNPDERAPWNLSHEALYQEMTTIARQRGLRFTLYDGLSRRTDAEAYRRLEEDIAAGRLGGLVLALFPGELMDLPVFTQGNLPPAVAMTSSPPGETVRRWPWMIPGPSTEYAKFIEEAMRFLASRGRRRLATIALWEQGEWELVRSAARRRGMACPDHFNHWLNERDLKAADHICQLLMMSSDRPDALLLADDNLVPDATAGLKASVRYHPQDLDIVAWCNFPHPPVSHVPVHFMGLDVRQYLLDCVALIQAEQARRKRRAASRG